jgi:diguanylate cyclase (GGDEF)-like protein/PAS domain S-box-containing protein
LKKKAGRPSRTESAGHPAQQRSGAQSLLRRLDRQFPLAVKIAVPLVFITVATSALLGAYATASTKSRLEDDYATQLRQIESSVQVVYGFSPNDPQTMNRLLREIKRADPVVLLVRVYKGGKQPEVWASSDPIDVRKVTPKPADLLPIRTGQDSTTRTEAAGGGVQVTRVPLTSGGHTTAALGLYTRLGPLNDAIAGDRRHTELVAGVAIVVQVIALLFLLYWAVLRRVARLSRSAALVASGYLAVHLPEGGEPRGRDAIANVGREFDHMLRAIEARTKQQAAVAALGQRALTEASVEGLLGEATRLVAQTLGVRFGMLLQLSADRSQLVLRAGEGWPAGTVGAASIDAAASTQAGYTLQAGAPVVSADLSTERRFSAETLLRQQGIVSCVTVPVGGEERPYGVLGAASVSPRTFTGDDINFVQAVANALAEAINRTAAERELSGSQAKTGAILDAALDCIITMDHEGRIVEFNPAAERTFRVHREQAVGADLADLIIPEAMREKHRQGLQLYLSTGREGMLGTRAEVMALRADGSEFPVELSIGRVPSSDPPLFTAFLRDITDRKHAEEQIAYLAYHDRLTGLPNRAMFEQFLELAIARAKRSDGRLAVAVVFVDLDNFKLVNDSLGHEAGDELLRQMAARLQDVTRDTDLVARQGGDEFLILLGDMERKSDAPLLDVSDQAVAGAERVAQRIQEALQAPFALADTEFFVSASMGLSVFPVDADDASTLLKNADSAMYRSKRSEPGGFLVYSRERADTVNRLALSTKLRKAVEERQWVLYYQPLVDLATGDTVGAEALIRWRDPSGTIIGPGEFIPLAEEMGLISAIGDWVLSEVCRQIRAWRDMGITLRVSYNLSPRQLWQPDLAQRISLRLESAGVDPSLVEIEVTESAAMSDPERTQRVLQDLNARGMHIAIDDFGTGYSSLSRLKHLPVNVLKVDRSFVSDVPGDADASSIVIGIINLARSLGLTPLAEGIETEDQWRFLLEQGCLLGQGYLFSRPVPAEEIASRQLGSGLHLVREEEPPAQAIGFN